MNVCLISVRADGGHTDVPMKRPSVKIGRSPTADIRIPVASVSREHCEIAAGNGSIRIRDLGSSNGTYVNRKRVQEAELKPGDLVGVGPAVFLIQVDGHPSQIHASKFFEEGAAPATASHHTPAPATAPTASTPPPRPASPTSSKPKPANSPTPPTSPGKPGRKSLLDDDDDDFELTNEDSGSGSFGDINFDDLKDDDEDDQPPLKSASPPPPGGKKK